MKSQAQRILDRLQRKSLTSVEAMNEMGIGRLASRICELRQDGHDIVTQKKTVINRFGEECHIGVYRLMCERKQNQ